MDQSCSTAYGFFCSTASAEQSTNEVLIQAPIQKVYDYVSLPHRWHEWHPTSLSADTAAVGALKQGERFTEKIRIYGQETQMSYEVLIASPPNEFKTTFTSALIDGTIHYAGSNAATARCSSEPSITR